MKWVWVTRLAANTSRGIAAPCPAATAQVSHSSAQYGISR